MQDISPDFYNKRSWKFRNFTFEHLSHKMARPKGIAAVNPFLSGKFKLDCSISSFKNVDGYGFLGLHVDLLDKPQEYPIYAKISLFYSMEDDFHYKEIPFTVGHHQTDFRGNYFVFTEISSGHYVLGFNPSSSFEGPRHRAMMFSEPAGLYNLCVFVQVANKLDTGYSVHGLDGSIFAFKSCREEVVDEIKSGFSKINILEGEERTESNKDK